jgi:predicted anti-sigma-YlaC factor YlaD
MLTCDEATELIRSGHDSVLGAVGGARLREHLEQCSSCRSSARTQELIRDLLVRRPEEALPSGFEARLAARLDAERGVDWLGLINWRTWSIRLLPAAAIMLAFAIGIGRWQRADPQLAEGLSRMLANGTVADVLLDSGADGEALMLQEFLLGRANQASRRSTR